MALQFKIQLQGITKPPVWRRVIVSETLTFDDFHKVIQTLFDWGNYHLYQFIAVGNDPYPVIAIPSKDDWEQPDLNALKTKLKKVFSSEKQTLYYIYDFGDNWVHHIVLERILPGIGISPGCMAGKGACPPEDCGGAWGYENLKIIMANPSHEEHQEMKEWLGLVDDGKWDAGAFDQDEVNERLKDYK